MSAEALPISPARFAKALEDLPISSLYGKYAELTNQIQHLESSNKELEEYARENDDRDCYEALLENRQVMKRFQERIELIKKEVQEVRGLPFRPQGEEIEATTPVTNGTAPGLRNGDATTSGAAPQEQSNGPAAHNADEEDGVFL
ncbi:Nn.00g019010.m01.CDS01 [Neocucurbitaria sp. VM-36]